MDNEAKKNKPGDASRDNDKEKQKIEREEILKTIDTGILSKSSFEQRIESLVNKGYKRGRRYSIIGIISSVLICIVVLSVGYYLVNQISSLVTQVNKETEESLSTTVKPNLTELVIPKKWKECSNDDDCIVTQGDCCPCQNGGLQTAINKNHADTWLSRKSVKCANQECLGEDKCLIGGTACHNNICVFIEGLKPCILPGAEIIFSTSTPVDSRCCVGLKAIADNGTGKYFCLPCGNSNCDIGENEMNCQEDCRPTASTSDSAILSDVDQDGLNDTDEIKYSTDPNNPDSDSDGYSDLDEINRGYNPNGEGELNKI